MDTTFLIAIDGPDKPGILNELSSTISQHNGHWLTSKSNNLDGHFFALIRVSVEQSAFEPLQQQLLALDQLNVQIHQSPLGQQGDHSYHWNIESDDHPSLIQDITTIITNHGANIDSFNNHRIAIPDSGLTAFTGDLLISGAASLDRHQIQQELENIHGQIVIRAV
ncbi:glycine cleavage system protein R [Ferrimonas lipolytica]|uniref:ACT domain-containing protein n=1 Tax=Ferrimonas lipolytica TaxID=2724191 RepID=A0A6H1UAN5_9GAMM|nr:ACT domain-containing protein [Ferrimonas lipolytica]QIZ76094.1 hypothetical protein HER31_03835 [Ferrimonas lipolytica]